ncbi:class F sortase [Demequina flava]|uniref:class F sortase n=1 Tax=Demequina flava TaxID=1095025 RepID=UPI0009E3A991|nr:class F sortase [Demequina flava]
MNAKPQHRPDARSPWRRMLGFVVTSGLVVSGCVAGGMSGAGASDVDAAPVPTTSPSVSSPLPAVSASARPVVDEVPIRSSAPDDQEKIEVDEPVSVAVPSLNIDMPVVPVGVEPDGAMEIPEDAGDAGWYKFGPAPSELQGNAVIAAHVDSPQGLGPFGRLPGVTVGAVVTVASAGGGSLTYEVTDVEQTDKNEVDLSAVFAEDGPAQLILVTCGGNWDAGRGHYDDNVVVTATVVDDVP